jgi:hypothetical protein
MRLHDLTDNDVVISLFNNCRDATFDRSGSVDQNRRSGFALAEGLSA